MSIELLPPDPVYPNTYHVRSNWCRCHPETCCCNDWAVHNPDGSKHSTYFHKTSAEDVASALSAAAKTLAATDSIEQLVAVASVDGANFNQRLLCYRNASVGGSFDADRHALIAHVDAHCARQVVAAVARPASHLKDAEEIIQRMMKERDELHAQLAHATEAWNRYEAKLASVWDGIREAVTKATGKPCGVEVFDDLHAALAGRGEHVAYAEDGNLHWLTGRKLQNCELYNRNTHTETAHGQKA